MAAEIQSGKAVVYGIQNGGSAIAITGFATFILDGVKGNHKFDLDAIKDESKFDASLIATNGCLEVEITFTPSGAKRSNATAVAAFIAPLAKTTLSNFSVTAFNGDWIYIGDESIDLSQGAAKMSLKLRKYDDATQNTSLTTTVGAG